MLVCDSQIHLWADSTPERPWPEGGQETFNNNPHRTAPMLAPEMISLMDEAGIDRAVIVPPGWEGNQVDISLQACRDYPGRFCIMPWVPLDDPDEGMKRLDAWKGEADIRGLRITFFNDEQRSWITDGTAEWYWDYAEKNDIPTAMFILTEKERVSELAIRHPGLRIVMDHLGVAGSLRGDPMTEAIEGVAKLAEHPNVSLKVSGTPGLSDEAYPFADVKPYLKTCIEAFGPERCYWGTDITRLMTKATYRQTVTHFTEELEFLSEADLDLIMGNAFCDFLGW